MPDRVVLVTGTGTEVGKTWVGARLLERLREQGVRVAARKPAQSFAAGDGPTDADVLAAATGEQPDEVCLLHRWYEQPMAPPMAAAVLGRPPFTIADLAAELVWPGAEVGLVEGVGGPRSPLAADGDTVTLADRIAPDAVVLVADAGLGTINAVRLCLAALAAHPVTVFLNRYVEGDELRRRNRDWLAAECGVVTETNELAAKLLGERRILAPSNPSPVTREPSTRAGVAADDATVELAPKKAGGQQDYQ